MSPGVTRPRHGRSLIVLAFAGCLGCAGSATAAEATEVGRAAGLEPEDVSAPVKIAGAAPEYPPELRERGLQGDVVIRMVITKEGRVGKAEFVAGSDGQFTEAVAKVLPTWRFEPARIIETGEAITSFIEITFPFRLR